MKRYIYAAVVVVFGVSSLAHAIQKEKLDSLDDLAPCMKQHKGDPDMCLRALEDYSKKHPKQNFEIGKKARVEFSQSTALRFFEPALKGNKDQKLCKDEDLGLAVLAGLGVGPTYDDAGRARRIFSGPCFKDILPMVQEDLKKENTQIKANACPVLKEKKVTDANCDKAPTT